MGIKCIAIGNRIMGDDAIGIKIAEELANEIIKEDIELIFGETDIEFALSKIEDDDFLFIIDSTYLNLVPGTVTITSICDLNLKNYNFSQHQPSLIHLIKTYNKRVKGYVIGIEIEEIDFSIELSKSLSDKFAQICEEVYAFIINNKSINIKS